MKKRLTQAITAATMAGMMVVTPVFAAPSVDSITQKKEQTEGEVASLQTKLTELTSKVSQLEIDLISKGEEITKAEKDLQKAQKAEEEQYADMKLRIQYMYEEGNKSFLEALTSASNFSDLVNKAEYVQNVHTYDRQMLEEYVETKQKVVDIKTTLEGDMSKLETMQTEFESDKEELDAALTSKEAQVADLDGQLREAVRLAAEEKAAEEKAAEEEQARQTQDSNTTNDNNNNNNGAAATPPSYQGEGNTATAQAIVSAAYSQIGVPYRWGGTTPGVGLDCSGLVQYAHSAAGLTIPRNSESQYAAGQKVSNPQPGDICYKPGHVAIYIGNGKMIEAQQTGTNIMISNVRATAYVRFW